jgi:hypothetical protein
MHRIPLTTSLVESSDLSRHYCYYPHREILDSSFHTFFTIESYYPLFDCTIREVANVGSVWSTQVYFLQAVRPKKPFFFQI